MKAVCHAGSRVRRQMQKVVSFIENAGSCRQAANSAGTVSVRPGHGRGERKVQGLIADSCANPLMKAPSGVKATR
jgi:hypothetical protein